MLIYILSTILTLGTPSPVCLPPKEIALPYVQSNVNRENRRKKSN